MHFVSFGMRCLISQHLPFPQAVLKEIREWLDMHPREVVILSFSHFLELNLECHNLLIQTIKDMFVSKLCPKTVGIIRKILLLIGQHKLNNHVY